MKTLRSLAIVSFCFAPAAVPFASRADDGFRVSYSAGLHDSRSVTVALGHLIGVHVGHEHPHRYNHRRPYVTHETHWNYAARVQRRHHLHDAHCRHSVRYGKRLIGGDPHVHWTRIVFRLRPEHTQQHVKQHHRRHHRDRARGHRSWRGPY